MEVFDVVPQFSCSTSYKFLKFNFSTTFILLSLHFFFRIDTRQLFTTNYKITLQLTTEKSISNISRLLFQIDVTQKSCALRVVLGKFFEFSLIFILRSHSCLI